MISDGPVRFNTILRELPAASKQAISVALRELETAGMLIKETIKQKPLHIEYRLSEKGGKAINVYKQAAILSDLLVDDGN
jgi:DNA-binding HxlR family transcriptional regulator